MKKQIPKIIHQIWLDRNLSNNETPPDKYLRLGYPFSWLERNPNHEYKLWNRDMVNNLLENHIILKKYSSFYSKLAHFIEKCDFARFLIMYAEGGVYIDLDFGCVKDISPLTEGKELQVWFEPIEHTEQWDAHIGRRLYNGFIASSVGHHFWLDWMDSIVSNYDPYKGAFFTTGPPAFAKFFNDNNYKSIHPEWLGNTCDVLAIISRQELAGICRNDKEAPNPIPQDYYRFNPVKIGHKPFDKIYAYTLWYEGSGWGQVTIDNSKNKGDELTTEFKNQVIQRRQKLSKMSNNTNDLTNSNNNNNNKNINMEEKKINNVNNTNSKKLNDKKVTKNVFQKLKNSWESASSTNQALIWTFVALSLAIIVILIVVVSIYVDRMSKKNRFYSYTKQPYDTFNENEILYKA